ncbi:MAG: hypothetical protein NTW87_36710 [Planctomycetota bacterium]|nr:hypothetical protein [Planctomycetota bacterium]
MKTKGLAALWDGEEVERLRQVRRAIERRCETFDGLCAHLERLEKHGRHATVAISRAKRSCGARPSKAVASHRSATRR